MATFGQGPQWLEVLQQPYTSSYAGGDVKGMWANRQTEMQAASRSALDRLAAALKAKRDAAMAELLAADAAKLAGSGGGGGGGGGRRGGGGGGKAPATPYAEVPMNESWLDQYVNSLPTTSAPPDQAPPFKLWGVPKVAPVSVNKGKVTRALPPTRKAKVVKAKSPTYSTRLS